MCAVCSGRAELLARGGELEVQVPDAGADAPAGVEGGQVDRVAAARARLVPLHARRARGPRRDLAGKCSPLMFEFTCSCLSGARPHLLSAFPCSPLPSSPLLSAPPAHLRASPRASAGHRERGAQSDHGSALPAPADGARQGLVVRYAHHAPRHGQPHRHHQPPHARYAPSHSFNFTFNFTFTLMFTRLRIRTHALLLYQ